MSQLKVDQLKNGELEIEPCAIKVFAGNANPRLAHDIAQIIGQPLGEMIITRFSDGELRCAINDSIRGADVFIVQPTCAPVSSSCSRRKCTRSRRDSTSPLRTLPLTVTET